MVVIGNYFERVKNGTSGFLLLNRGKIGYVTVEEAKILRRQNKIKNADFWISGTDLYGILQLIVKVDRVDNKYVITDVVTPQVAVILAEGVYANQQVVKFWFNKATYTLTYDLFFKFYDEYGCVLCNATVENNRIVSTTGEEFQHLSKVKISQIESTKEIINCNYRWNGDIFELMFIGGIDQDKQRYAYLCQYNKVTKKYSFYRRYNDHMVEANFTKGQKDEIKQIMQNVIKYGNIWG